MPEFISIAKATAKSDQIDTLTRELEARVAPTRAQPGNIAFELLGSTDDPATIVALERWQSREQWEQHLQGDHVTSLMAVFETALVQPPEIMTYTPL